MSSSIRTGNERPLAPANAMAASLVPAQTAPQVSGQVSPQGLSTLSAHPPPPLSMQKSRLAALHLPAMYGTPTSMDSTGQQGQAQPIAAVARLPRFIPEAPGMPAADLPAFARRSAEVAVTAADPVAPHKSAMTEPSRDTVACETGANVSFGSMTGARAAITIAKAGRLVDEFPDALTDEVRNPASLETGSGTASQRKSRFTSVLVSPRKRLRESIAAREKKISRPHCVAEDGAADKAPGSPVPKSVRFSNRDEYFDDPVTVRASCRRNAPGTAYFTKKTLDRLCRQVDAYACVPGLERAPRLLIEISALYTRAVSQAIAASAPVTASESSLMLGIAVNTYAEHFRLRAEHAGVLLPAAIMVDFDSVAALLREGFDSAIRRVRAQAGKTPSSRHDSTLSATLERAGVDRPGKDRRTKANVRQKLPQPGSGIVADLSTRASDACGPVGGSGTDVPTTCVAPPTAPVSTASLQFMPPTELMEALQSLQVWRMNENPTTVDRKSLSFPVPAALTRKNTARTRRTVSSHDLGPMMSRIGRSAKNATSITAAPAGVLAATSLSNSTATATATGTATVTTATTATAADTTVTADDASTAIAAPTSTAVIRMVATASTRKRVLAASADDGSQITDSATHRAPKASRTENRQSPGAPAIVASPADTDQHEVPAPPDALFS